MNAIMKQNLSVAVRRATSSAAPMVLDLIQVSRARHWVERLEIRRVLDGSGADCGDSGVADEVLSSEVEITVDYDPTIAESGVVELLDRPTEDIQPEWRIDDNIDATEIELDTTLHAASSQTIFSEVVSDTGEVSSVYKVDSIGFGLLYRAVLTPMTYDTTEAPWELTANNLSLEIGQSVTLKFNAETGSYDVVDSIPAESTRDQSYVTITRVGLDDAGYLGAVAFDAEYFDQQIDFPEIYEMAPGEETVEQLADNEIEPWYRGGIESENGVATDQAIVFDVAEPVIRAGLAATLFASAGPIERDDAGVLAE
jgi:hypothetical protein